MVMYLVLRKELLPSQARDFSETQLISLLRERAEGEVRRAIELQEGGDSLIRELLRVIRGGAILPKQLRQLPPAPGFRVLPVVEVVAVPDGQVALFIRARVSGGEVELLGGVEQDVVGLHENGGAKLNRVEWVVVDVHRQSPTADVVGLLEDGDVQGNAGFFGIPAEMVGRGGPGRTGACQELKVSYAFHV